MPSSRVKATVGAALAVLGFRSAGAMRWRLNVPNAVPIIALLDGKTVYLKAEGTTLSRKVTRPLGADFVPRLRKRLGTLGKQALRTNKAQKRASRQAPSSTVEALSASLNARRASSPDADKFIYSGSRNYDPLAFCDTCHRMVRESLMATRSECRDCKEDK
jgi:hypothetical protein